MRDDLGMKDPISLGVQVFGVIDKTSNDNQLNLLNLKKYPNFGVLYFQYVTKKLEHHLS
jgi:hypothetical protein